MYYKPGAVPIPGITNLLSQVVKRVKVVIISANKFFTDLCYIFHDLPCMENLKKSCCRAIWTRNEDKKEVAVKSVLKGSAFDRERNCLSRSEKRQCVISE